MLTVVRMRLKISEDWFSYSVPCLWNKLPLDLRCSQPTPIILCCPPVCLFIRIISQVWICAILLSLLKISFKSDKVCEALWSCRLSELHLPCLAPTHFLSAGSPVLCFYKSYILSFHHVWHLLVRDNSLFCAINMSKKMSTDSNSEYPISRKLFTWYFSQNFNSIASQTVRL